MRTHPYSKPFVSDTDSKIYMDPYFVVSMAKMWDSFEDWIVTFYDGSKIHISTDDLEKYFSYACLYGSAKASKRLYKNRVAS